MSESNKRSAEVAGMDTSDQKLNKKQKQKQTNTPTGKRETALETRLTKLQQVLGPDELPPEWGAYDPGYFMEEMRRLGRKSMTLTLKTVANYISEDLERDLTSLEFQEIHLKEPVGGLGPGGPVFAQALRRQMIQYVAKVRTCLKGQSQ